MKATGRKNPALLELVLVILFFALSSMVLIQVFVKARTISRTSQAKTLGLVVIQDVLEQWKMDPAEVETLFLSELGWKKREADKTPGDKGTLLFYAEYSEDMYLLSEGEGMYCFEAAVSEQEQECGRVYRITVVLSERLTDSVIAECSTADYVPEEKKDEEGN